MSDRLAETVRRLGMLRMAAAAISVLIFSIAVGQAQILPPMTNDEVIQMVSAHIPDDAILAAINSSVPAFDFSVSEVQRLNGVGVSNALIGAMRRAAAKVAPAGDAKPGSNSAPDGTLTNSSIVAMVAAGLRDDVIIATIANAKEVRFETDWRSLIALQQAGVTPDVQKALIDAGQGGQRSPIPQEAPSKTVEIARESAESQKLVTQLRDFEKRLGELQQERDRAAADVRRFQASSSANNMGCDKASVLGAANCLAADLNSRAAASATERLKRLESDILDVQSKVNAQRLAVARDPVATRISSTSTSRVAPGANNANPPLGNTHLRFDLVMYKPYDDESYVGTLDITDGRLAWSETGDYYKVVFFHRDRKVRELKKRVSFSLSCSDVSTIRSTADKGMHKGVTGDELSRLSQRWGGGIVTTKNKEFAFLSFTGKTLPDQVKESEYKALFVPPDLEVMNAILRACPDVKIAD